MPWRDHGFHIVSFRKHEAKEQSQDGLQDQTHCCPVYDEMGSFVRACVCWLVIPAEAQRKAGNQ